MRVPCPAGASARVTVLVQRGHFEVQIARQTPWHGTCIAVHSADPVL